MRSNCIPCALWCICRYSLQTMCNCFKTIITASVGVIRPARLITLTSTTFIIICIYNVLRKPLPIIIYYKIGVIFPWYFCSLLFANFSSEDYSFLAQWCMSSWRDGNQIVWPRVLAGLVVHDKLQQRAPGATPNDGLKVDTPPERGTFFTL